MGLDLYLLVYTGTIRKLWWNDQYIIYLKKKRTFTRCHSNIFGSVQICALERVKKKEDPQARPRLELVSSAIVSDSVCIMYVYVCSHAP